MYFVLLSFYELGQTLKRQFITCIMLVPRLRQVSHQTSFAMVSKERIYRSADTPLHIPEVSIYTHIFSNCQLGSKHPAFVDITSGRTYSREDVHDISLQVAWAVQNILSIKEGDVIAIFSVNSALWALTFLGCTAAGARVTTVNSSYTPAELQHQLNVSLPKFKAFSFSSNSVLIKKNSG